MGNEIYMRTSELLDKFEQLTLNQTMTQERSDLRAEIALRMRNSYPDIATWIRCDGKTCLWYCSSCGEKVLYNPSRRTYNIKKKAMHELNKFCRNCGSRMGGEVVWCTMPSSDLMR